LIGRRLAGQEIFDSCSSILSQYSSAVTRRVEAAYFEPEVRRQRHLLRGLH